MDTVRATETHCTPSAVFSLAPVGSSSFAAPQDVSGMAARSPDVMSLNKGFFTRNSDHGFSRKLQSMDVLWTPQVSCLLICNQPWHPVTRQVLYQRSPRPVGGGRYADPDLARVPDISPMVTQVATDKLTRYKATCTMQGG